MYFEEEKHLKLILHWFYTGVWNRKHKNKVGEKTVFKMWSQDSEKMLYLALNVL